MAKPKLTPKQERFANLVAEGNAYSVAYREAYDAENMSNEVIWVKASELMSNGKVAVRVMDLQERAAERTLVTVESITKELQEAAELAKDERQPAAMTGAIMGKAKINGLIVNKSEVTRKRNIEDLDDGEIDALIASAESREGKEGEIPTQPSSVH